MEKITFLGQAGLLFELNGVNLIIDPYLSNNVEKFEPQNYRRQPIEQKFLNIVPNVIVITHNHLDHYDKETLKYYLSNGSSVKVLCPTSVFHDLIDKYKTCDCVLFDVGCNLTVYGMEFTAVKAKHSDTFAIGVIIKINERSYYVTGDTLLDLDVIESLPKIEFNAVFLPINGKGNNMGVVQATEFLDLIAYKYCVPVHFGLFDDMTGCELKAKNCIIPKIYKEIKFK